MKMSGFQPGANFRGGSAMDLNADASDVDRGGYGSTGQEPHSSAGFRRALMRSGRQGSSLKDQLPSKMTFGGKGFKKPNYFAQGGQRHGMHMGSGAPFTGGAQAEGADFGG